MFWAEMSALQVEKFAKENYMVLLPCGSLEQHGKHLPVDTDSNIITAISKGINEIVSQTLILPTLWLGFSPQHGGVPGTIGLSLETYIVTVKEIIQSIHEYGFKRMVILNGHGANDEPLKATVRSLIRTVSMRLLVLTYWDLINAESVKQIRTGDIGSIGHAGEMETSLQLYLRPRLVDMSQAASSPIRPKLKHQWADLFAPGPVFMMDSPHRPVEPFVRGDALAASGEKGEKFLRCSIEALAEYLEEFKGMDT